MLLWLLSEADVSIEDLSGTSDMRVLLAREDDAARTALDVYIHRLRGAIASMAAAMNGLDVLTFTGGVGERAAPVRAAAAAGLGFLGVILDETRNGRARADTGIAAASSAVKVFVIEAREDAEIARQVRDLLS